MTQCTMQHLHKGFKETKVLEDFSYTFADGKITAVTGTSGSGKSTLLNLIGLLDSPDQGTVTLFEHTNRKPFSKQAMLLLRYKIGYLFQNFALIDNQSVKDNLMIALAYTKHKNKAEKIREVLQRVGLAGFENKTIYQCSGGEQQRIAIARLLLKPCELILADEPTGSLDYENKKLVFDLLKQLNKEGKTIIIVTHDEEISQACDAVVHIEKLVLAKQ